MGNTFAIYFEDCREKSLHETVIVRLNLPNHIALLVTSNIFPVKKSKVNVDTRWELLVVFGGGFVL